ncbi:MAG TPA: hypothetical protein VNX02_08365 [Steroidobacteraceae bacterium]|jgi:hypothetical protein|nr:hypothetical protein [Steroidobacteraceae bacterium]
MGKTQANPAITESQSTDCLLRVIIALLVRQREEEVAPLKRQIEILDSLGMRPVEIAETLGKTAGHVNKELAGIRKHNKRSE